MARFATPEGKAAGLYRYLEERERADLAEWERGERRRMLNGYSSGEYPRQRRVDAFAAGRAVNVAPGDIWGWGAVHTEGALVVQRPPGDGSRVVVHPDDSVRWSDDDWAALFVEENDV